MGGAKSSLCALGVGTDSAVPKERSNRDQAGFLPPASHPTRAGGHKTEHLLLSCLPQEPDQHRGED